MTLGSSLLSPSSSSAVSGFISATGYRSRKSSLFGCTLSLRKKRRSVAYFTVPVSWPEYGALEEIPLYPSQVEDFAKSGRFFWRDPDGTERPLKTIKEE